jgi:probable F420-dependent oxidoreductase
LILAATSCGVNLEVFDHREWRDQPIEPSTRIGASARITTITHPPRSRGVGVRMEAAMGSSRPFRFGVINERMQAADAWVRQARETEKLGYSTFLIRDHFVPDHFGDQFAPFSALMAAANVTRTMRVGTLVIDNDYRHPVVLAKEVATLDLLSGGRFEVGLGAGFLKTEYDKAGLTFDPPGVRISRLTEALEVLKGLFADGPVTFHGQHYRIDELDGYPKPVQRPHPPIHIGAGSKRMLMLAGREANTVGLLNSSTRTGTLVDDPVERLADTLAQKLAWVRDGAGERFPDIELSMTMALEVTGDRRQAAETLIRAREWHTVTVAQVLDMPSIFIGSIDEICEVMEARRERFGISYYVVPDRLRDSLAPVVERLSGR